MIACCFFLSKYISLQRIFLLCLLMGLGSIAYVSVAQYQTKKIEKERKTRLQEIKEKRNLLSQIHTRREVSMNELSFIKMKIQVQTQLVQVLEQELDSLQDNLEKMQTSIQKLTDQLQQLKEEYAKMVYVAARSHQDLQKLSFVFASENFHQLYRRSKYLQQYTQARHNQVAYIKQIHQQLSQKQALAQKMAQEKQTLLEEKKPEIDILKALQQEKDQLIKSLSKQEKTIIKELKKSQVKLENLDNLVDNFVKEQKENKPTYVAVPRKKTGKPDTKQLTKDFVRSKGKLPSPIVRGFLASYFGKQKHPVLKNVFIDNAGIEIQSPAGQAVRAVFQGEVSTIATIPGMGGQVLMLQHGEYFTVYAKIEKLTVKVGDWLDKGDEFAKVHKDSKGLSRLQFQVWKGSQKLNPIHWIKKP